MSATVNAFKSFAKDSTSVQSTHLHLYCNHKRTLRQLKNKRRTGRRMKLWSFAVCFDFPFVCILSEDWDVPLPKGRCAVGGTNVSRQGLAKVHTASAPKVKPTSWPLGKTAFLGPCSSWWYLQPLWGQAAGMASSIQSYVNTVTCEKV